MSTGRRRSASSVANDRRIRESIVTQIVAVGIDALGPTGVARGAELTTGAVYGRYENVPEMAVDVWIQDLRDRHFAFVDNVTDAVLGGGGAELDNVLSGVGERIAADRAAIEILAAAHRVDELDEVVGADVRDWLQRRGAGPDATDPAHRARLLWVVAGVWGMCLVDLAGGDNSGAPDSLRWTARAMANVTPAPSPPQWRPGSELVVDTGDEVRDALLVAAMEVISRMGVARSTVSRIARRAGVTPSWLYGVYVTKQALLADTLQELVDGVLARTEQRDLAMGEDADVLTRVAEGVHIYLGEDRTPWRRLRLESYLAARHHPQVAEALLATSDEALWTYPVAVGVADPQHIEGLLPMLRFFSAAQLGLALLDALVGPLDDVDWRLAVWPYGLAPTSQVA